MTQPQADIPSTSRAGEQAILTVTCLAAFLFFNSFGSIGVALPAIQKQFGNSPSEIQWITLMGVVTISSLSFCFGRAGSRFGQRRLYKTGIALYTAGAGLGAVSETFLQLLGARAVMAVGLAMALPMSTAILAASFDPGRRGRVLGLFASAIAVGRMTGPALGGLLLHLSGWARIFWMNFIVGFAVTVAVVKIFRGPGETRREVFDVRGAIALLIGYPALLIALTLGSGLGWHSGPVITAFVLAGVGLCSFIRIEGSAVNPLIDLAVIKQPALALALLGGGIGIFTPANQKIAFASVRQEDYGVLAAMLSSFGTAAGTIGTTVVVALMEFDGGRKLWEYPEAFAAAQQFAFASLMPAGLVAIGIALKCRGVGPAGAKI